MPALPTFSFAAGPEPVVRAAEVDRARLARERDLDGAVDLPRQPERAGEVPAGSARDHRDLDAVAFRDPVHDLVHRSVASDDDQQLSAFVGGATRQLD